MANIDPLGLNAWRKTIPPPELDPKFHGFEAKCVDSPKSFCIGPTKRDAGSFLLAPSLLHAVVVEFVWEREIANVLLAAL